MKLSSESVREPPADLVALRIDGVVVAKLDPTTSTLWFRTRQHGRKLDLSISVRNFVELVNRKGLNDV